MSSTCDNVVVGAGPVGLLMASFLGAMGQRVTVIEKSEKPAAWSRAIGVSPPSLEILARLGLDKELVRRGHPIQRVGVHGSAGFQKFIGKVSFETIPGDYPYMLSVPQEVTEDVLRKGLVKFPNVEIRWGHALSGISTRRHLSPPDTSGTAHERPELQVRIEESGENYSLEPLRVFACDGSKSSVRQLLGIEWKGHRYPYSFVMGDFEDRSDFGDEAHLFFTPSGAVESFPLPRNKRRWIVQTPVYQDEPDAELITATIKQRTGLDIDPSLMTWRSPFGVQRNIAARYRIGNIFLLGDAAHIMSPIGGQGMNTGFADAEALARIIEAETGSKHLFGDAAKGAVPGESRETVLADWERQRRKAFRVAADRAWRGMFLGTVRGRLGGALRNLALWVMLNGPFKSRVPLDYAMLTIPYRNLRAENGAFAAVSGKRKKLA